MGLFVAVINVERKTFGVVVSLFGSVGTTVITEGGLVFAFVNGITVSGRKVEISADVVVLNASGVSEGCFFLIIGFFVIIIFGIVGIFSSPEPKAHKVSL